MSTETLDAVLENLLTCDGLALETVVGFERSGYQRGWRDCWVACEQASSNAWTPIAQRVRREAGLPSWEQLLEARNEEPDGKGGFRTRPRPGDYAGGPVTWPDETNRGPA